MGMTEDDKRNCCLLEIQETEAKYYKTLEDIEKVRAEPCFPHELWHPTWIMLGWFLLQNWEMWGAGWRKMGEEGETQNPEKQQGAGGKTSIFYCDCCRLEPAWKPLLLCAPILGWESPTPGSARPGLLIRAVFADISYHSDCHGIIPLFRVLKLCWLAIEANWIKRNVLLPKFVGV